ncbi:MAG: SDR family oxidoreductase [Nitrososphaerota archaeon]|nr:SDR family oxidoreductase [Nitrososphaerota archaeon]MDG7024401.1 SDR family oxidoreductase [Nitrososphaerota archaeon]
MRRLLILGANGFVGNLAARMAAVQDKVVGTYNVRPGPLTSCKWVKLSLPRDEHKLESIVTITSPDVVINAIAYANVDECETHRSVAYYLNTAFPEKLAEVCISQGIPVLHFSTDYVFDGERGGYTEEDAPNPVNYYGRTKRDGEKAILREPRNVVLRTSSVYTLGPGSRFVDFVLHSLKSGSKLNLFSDIRSSPTYGQDVAKSTLLLVDKKLEGIYHVSGPSCVSRYEFGLLLAQEFGYDTGSIRAVSFTTDSRYAVRPKNTCLSSLKAQEDLGVELLGLREGLSAAHQDLNHTSLK